MGTPTVIIGAVTMKMIRSTSMTSTSGVTLISLINALLARPRRPRPPEPLLPTDMPMAFNPALVKSVA
jgi:hypothetical protein